MTDEEREEQAKAWIKTVEETAPEKLKASHVLTVAGSLITSYAENADEAAAWVGVLTQSLAAYYADNETTDKNVH